MLLYISTAVVLIIDFIAVEIKKSYHSLTNRELKYRASQGDNLAKQVYRVAAYGRALEVFLWAVIALSSVGSIFLINAYAPIWFSFIIAVLLIWLVFIKMPSTKVSLLTNTLMRYCVPTVAWIMHYLYPVIKVLRLGSHERDNHHPSHIYDQQDLLNLISKLKNQPDSRIDPKILGTVKHFLSVQSVKVRDAAKPWSRVKIVNSEETVGPVLLDELHKSHQQFIPVKDKNEPKKIIGLLDMTRLDINLQGKVSHYMDRIVYYLNEDDTIDDALYAFGHTNYPAFVVIDDKNRFIGLLTLQDVIGKIINHQQADGVEEDYTTIDAVAQKYVAKEEPEVEQTEAPS